MKGSTYQNLSKNHQCGHQLTFQPVMDHEQWAAARAKVGKLVFITADPGRIRPSPNSRGRIRQIRGAAPEALMLWRAEGLAAPQNRLLGVINRLNCQPKIGRPHRARSQV